METEYSKRELDYHFTTIKDALYRIEAQTIKTNGRVSILERWRYMLVGGMVVLGALNIPTLKALAAFLQ